MGALCVHCMWEMLKMQVFLSTCLKTRNVKRDARVVMAQESLYYTKMDNGNQKIVRVLLYSVFSDAYLSTRTYVCHTVCEMFKVHYVRFSSENSINVYCSLDIICRTDSGLWTKLSSSKKDSTPNITILLPLKRRQDENTENEDVWGLDTHPQGASFGAARHLSCVLNDDADRGVGACRSGVVLISSAAHFNLSPDQTIDIGLPQQHRHAECGFIACCHFHKCYCRQHISNPTEANACLP